jgi:hypothetical protein
MQVELTGSGDRQNKEKREESGDLQEAESEKTYLLRILNPKP